LVEGGRGDKTKKGEKRRCHFLTSTSFPTMGVEGVRQGKKKKEMRRRFGGEKVMNLRRVQGRGGGG